MKRILRSIAAAVVLVYLLPVSAWAAEFLVPVGRIIGLQLQDESVTVAAFDDTFGTFAREAGIKIGDEIVTVDGHDVDCADDIRQAIRDSEGQVSLTLRRNGKTRSVKITPAQTESGPRLGVYLRQGIAGIGTVTWYDPDTGKFGTLGHGVSDAKGNLLKMTGGNAYEAEILTVKKGRSGEPGQLKGTAENMDICGELVRNTPQGVFGVSKRGWRGEPLPVADFGEIHTGEAVILSTVSVNEPREYSVEILKIYPKDRSDNRNFLLKVTDPQLLEITGGIVQGMSGSPLLQDGKIIGAVTHVCVFG